MMRSTGRRCLLLAVAALGGAAALAPAADGAPPMNQWQPLTPGLQSVARGFVNAGSRRLPHTRVYTVTDVVKVIHGVRSVAVLDQDIDGGQIVEQAIDYLAIDAKGNVWYPAPTPRATRRAASPARMDGWLDGRQGRRRPASSCQPARASGTAAYFEQQVPGEEATSAQVVKTGIRRSASRSGASRTSS